MFKYLILLLLLTPIVFAGDYDLLNVKIENEPTMSNECRAQYSQFMNQQPEELIEQYCGAVNTRLVFILSIIFIMWLIEPRLGVVLDKKGYGWAKQYYKWIGLGLIFMVAYAIFIMG